jgi:hypothetical protein
VTEPRKYIEVIELATGKAVHQVEVTGKSERCIDKTLAGMLRNLDRENFCLREPQP